MKRILLLPFILTLLFSIITTTSISYAKDRVKGDASFKGLEINYTESQILNMYGEPNKKIPYFNVLLADAIVCQDYIYGDRLTIRIGEKDGSWQGRVSYIQVFSSTGQDIGINTLAGVHLGMPYEEAKDIYKIDSSSNQFYVIDPTRRTYLIIYSSKKSNGERYVSQMNLQPMSDDSFIRSLEQ